MQFRLFHQPTFFRANIVQIRNEGGLWYIYGYTEQSTKQNSESERKILEISATSRDRTSDLLAEVQILSRLSYGGSGRVAIAAAYPKLGETCAPFWPSIFRGFQCHHCWAGRSLAFNGTFPRSNPTVAASTGSTLGGAWRWEAAPIPDAWGGGRAAGGPENGPYTHVPMCGPRYVFYLIYPPPPGIELTLPGGGSGALPLGQGGGD